MSKNLMDTEKGGEQTQYEGVHTFIQPHDKQSGQLGDPSQGTHLASQTKKPTNEPNTQGVTPADKIRYGQSIQEGGMGGKTNASGEANSGGGFGGTQANDEQEDAAKLRREQGYGGVNDQDRNIGA